MNKYYVELRLHLIRNAFKRAEFLKKNKVFHSMGESCYFHPRKIPRETYLVSFGNNVVVAANVTFIPHDIVGVMLKNREESKDCGRIFLGKIVVGDNVFIGANSVILPNVTIGSNSIIAAGSIVAKSVPENSVVGGNPAHVIKSIDSFVEKRRMEIDNMPSWREPEEILEKFFWNE